MRLARRRLVLLGCALAGADLARVALAGVAPSSSMSPKTAARSTATGENEPAVDPAQAKRLTLYNLHTQERLHSTYFRDDVYVADSLAAIQVLLRDYRNGEQHAIDPKLMDYLYDVARHAGADPDFSVVSGYRSPQTNERLRERSSGVARNSLHMQGRAIDVRLAGIDCEDLAARALDLRRGGVGYYRQSNFVHLDTGPFRTWNG